MLVIFSSHMKLLKCVSICSIQRNFGIMKVLEEQSKKDYLMLQHQAVHCNS